VSNITRDRQHHEEAGNAHNIIVLSVYPVVLLRERRVSPMKKTLWLLAILVPVMIGALQPALAQPNPTIIVPNPLFGPRIFYVSDLDLLRQGGGPVLFQITINSNGNIAHPWLRTTLKNGAGEQLAVGNLNLSSFGSVSPWIITNLNISGAHGNWEAADNLSSRYQTQILRTGMIPADIYTYTFQVYDGDPSNGGLALGSSVPSSFTVLGMGYLTLRFPDNDPRGDTPLMSTLPFFVWNSSQTNFTIKIAEIHSGETPDAALNSRENCEASVTGASFQYPSTGVVPLETGKYYAWQVKTSISTSHGPFEVASEINVFRIAPTMTPESTQLLVALQQLLTDGNGPQILQMIQRGQLSGEIYLGDQRITAQQLFAMLPDFSAHHFTIHTMRVE